MARLLAFLTLFAVCACDQQSPYGYSPYGSSQYAPYQQTYPYDQNAGWQRNRSPQASPYAGGQRQQGSAGAPQAQRWTYPDGTVRTGVYDPNTGTMK